MENVARLSIAQKILFKNPFHFNLEVNGEPEQKQLDTFKTKPRPLGNDNKKKKTKSTKQYSTDTLKQKMTNKEVCNVSLARRQANKLPGQAKHAVISVVVSRHRQCHL